MAVQHLRLDDGRTLAYSESGDAQGAPVVYCHGLPGSRLEYWGGGDVWSRVGVRLIGVDRPGIGRSDPQPGRSVVDWAGDVEQLARALGLARFVVVGHSAGAAYALACAARTTTDALIAASVVGPIPRVDRSDGLRQLGTARFWHIAERSPARMRLAYRALAVGMRVAPAGTARLLFRDAAEPDRSLFTNRDVLERFRVSVRDGMRRGPAGLVEDMRTLMQPWGFELAEIRRPVRLWHGEADGHVPSLVSTGYSDEITEASAHVLPDEGHFSLIERSAEAIFADAIAPLA